MMASEKRTILFTLIHDGEEYKIQTYKNEYHSLMSLISNHLSLLNFGFCNGMGSCGSCMVNMYLKRPEAKISRFSCEVPINDNLANMRIEI